MPTDGWSVSAPAAGFCRRTGRACQSTPMPAITKRQPVSDWLDALSIFYNSGCVLMQVYSSHIVLSGPRPTSGLSTSLPASGESHFSRHCCQLGSNPLTAPPRHIPLNTRRAAVVGTDTPSRGSSAEERNIRGTSRAAWIARINKSTCAAEDSVQPPGLTLFTLPALATASGLPPLSPIALCPSSANKRDLAAGGCCLFPGGGGK